MQIIDELEPTRRGLYGGVVGYLDFAGDADTAITIRTALVADGAAYVQAGPVSSPTPFPAYEDAECRNKARRRVGGRRRRGATAHGRGDGGRARCR